MILVRATTRWLSFLDLNIAGSRGSNSNQSDEQSGAASLLPLTNTVERSLRLENLAGIAHAGPGIVPAPKFRFLLKVTFDRDQRLRLHRRDLNFVGSLADELLESFDGIECSATD
jgi:hypothetical protein